MDKKLIIICVLCMLLGFILGLFIRKEEEPKIITEYKEVVIRDTVEVEVPIPEVDIIIETEYVSIPSETIVIETDSTSLVKIPIQEKIYETDKYKATITGYNPNLKDMVLYNETVVQTVTNTEYRYKNPKLVLGIGAGVSYMPFVPQGTNKFQPSFNVSIFVPIKTIF